MLTFKQARKYGAKIAVVAAPAVMFISTAHAALPTAVQDAIDASVADGTLAVTAGGVGLMTLAGVGVVFGIAISYIRRMRRG